MRSIVLAVLVLAACTKPNPSVCCTDEADCNAKGIPIGSRCGEGLLCRGNQCIAQPCSGSSECDSSAPYCVAESCAETCSEDSQCPGFMEAPEQQFCESGACVQCRDGVSDDCATTEPVCDSGACRTCAAHAECSTGVCQPDGQCAPAADIAYVATTGSSTSECLQASPCSTIARAVTLTPARKYILIDSGTYASSTTLSFEGVRWLIGRGSAKPVITRTTPGPIVTVGYDVAATFDNLEISGATTSGQEYGHGVFHDGNFVGPAMIRFIRSNISNNAGSGAHIPRASFEATETRFADNGLAGLWTQDNPGTIDRCLVVSNQSGLYLDGGVYTITNSIIARNTGDDGGIFLYSRNPSNKVEFNTIVDNGVNASSGASGAGIQCAVLDTTASFPNNIIARNKQQTFGNNCTYPGSIVVDTDITGLAFASPDTAPYDYHLTAGSIAIDAATISTIDHDVDGDARPNGDGRDVGADEFVQ